MSLKKFSEIIEIHSAEEITLLALTRDDEAFALYEGKWISGRYKNNIRIDRDTHLHSVDGDGRHAHVYGRRDRDNALVVVRADGSKSHNRGGILHKADAAALRAQGIDVPENGLVEYHAYSSLIAGGPELLVEFKLP